MREDEEPPPYTARDLVQIAHLLVDSVDLLKLSDLVDERTADPGERGRMVSLDTEFGRADVVLDDGAVDVVLHDREATVHVRTDRTEKPPNSL